MSANEVLVRVENLSKIFCRNLKKSLWYGVRDIFSELYPFGSGRSLDSQMRKGTEANGLRQEEFWAVKNVSFELRRGECLGLIGRNGAGKTTLLKLLNGLIKPDTGRIEIRGRVGAIIALGAGFNPVLSGRENIYINGAILGLTKQDIDKQVDEIIDFAEIREFIDAPVQSYSSGMLVRLGFAVATTLKPDVLLLDEVLAVGDASFRHKCYHRINKLIRKSAVIFVSHSMEQVGAVASSIGLMVRGDFRHFDQVDAGISAYIDANAGDMPEGRDGGRIFACYPPITKAQVQITDPVVQYGGCLEIQVELECSEPLSNVLISFTALNELEQPVMNWNSSRRHGVIDLPKGTMLIRFRIEPLLLHDGNYHWNLNIKKLGFIEHLVWAMRAGSFSVSSPYRPISHIPYIPDPSKFELVHGLTPRLSVEKAEMINVEETIS